LDLQQEVIFRGLAERPIEEDDLNARLRQFIQEQDLVRIVARQPIRALHVEAIQLSSGSQIAHSLQCWSD
jgi:hypothetical protein